MVKPRVFLAPGVGAWLVATSALTGLAAAAPTDVAAGDAARRALVTQKSRLLEQVLASPRARTLLAEGRQAADAGETLRAEAAVDEALRLVTTATSARSTAARADGTLPLRNAELLQQVSLYRSALVTALAARKDRQQTSTLAVLDQFVAEAEKASAVGRHDDANKSLTQAYRLAVISLSEVRAGETITIELEFDTPADEFAYEQRLHQSHELLVDMAVAERKPAAEVLALIAQQVTHARVLRGRADERATAGDHAAAIKLMEQATGHLVRAIQAAGVPVFR